MALLILSHHDLYPETKSINGRDLWSIAIKGTKRPHMQQRERKTRVCSDLKSVQRDAKRRQQRSADFSPARRPLNAAASWRRQSFQQPGSDVLCTFSRKQDAWAESRASGGVWDSRREQLGGRASEEKWSGQWSKGSSLGSKWSREQSAGDRGPLPVFIEFGERKKA
jgi:hypothetical protein